VKSVPTTVWLRNQSGLAVLFLLLCAACGSSTPSRFVIERDLGDFAYRRYQETVDVEVTIEGNPAVGHTATYIRRDHDRVAVATAFVTVYTHGKALAAHIREKLEGLSGYEFRAGELSGESVWRMDGGRDERWAVWVSGKVLVKLGAPEGAEIPDSVADAYLALYPSDLDEHGRSRPGTGSHGSLPRDDEEAAEPERALPEHLRENAPR
jgi:hypothetical protein